MDRHRAPLAARSSRHRTWNRFSALDLGVYGLVSLICILCVAPYLYVISVSFTDPAVYVPFKLYLFPEKASLRTYAYILANSSFVTALKNTVYITVVATSLNVAVTFSFAYGLTKRQMPFWNLLSGMVVFSLLFSPGIIPNYLMVKAVGLINSRWALILPVITNAWSLIIARSFLDSIPKELDESAKMDGANDIGIFLRIIVPLSTAAIATLTLFFAVGHWNVYFNALVYLTDPDKRTLQVYVKALLVDSSTGGAGELAATGLDVMNMPSESVRLATVVLAMLPILLVYPFLQRYFIKGVMLGAIKG